jgi:hypothetical protein
MLNNPGRLEIPSAIGRVLRPIPAYARGTFMPAGFVQVFGESRPEMNLGRHNAALNSLDREIAEGTIVEILFTFCDPPMIVATFERKGD